MGGDSRKGFEMDASGAIRVKEAGVYLVYAQVVHHSEIFQQTWIQNNSFKVAYLDEHDVNAFQVLANDKAFLLCTSMTHTPHSTTKVLGLNGYSVYNYPDIKYLKYPGIYISKQHVFETSKVKPTECCLFVADYCKLLTLPAFIVAKLRRAD